MSETPVSFAVDEYLADIAGSMEPGSYINYRGKLNRFAAWCDGHGVFLSGVRNKIVTEFISFLKKTYHGPRGEPLASKTVFGYVRTIKTFLYWCLRDESPFQEECSLLFVRNIRMPKVESPIVDVFTDKQIEALLAACALEQNEYMRARAVSVVMLLGATGVRAQELCTLTIGNCHTGVESYIMVLGKGRKWREVPFDKETRRKLSAYLIKFRRGAAPSECVFTNRSGRGSLTVPALQQLIERLGARAGITDIRVHPHVFRHTAAARWYMLEGKDIFAVAKLLGHSSVSTTEKYLRTLSSRNMRLGVHVVK